MFSFVTPVYNVEDYLERCVVSLMNQTFRDVEIILVDDGSTDKCSELCDSFAEADTRIRVIHKENGGLSDARNAGLAEAKGDYILFVDSDDYVDVSACEKLLPFAEQGYDILAGQACFEGGKQVSYLNETGSVISGKDYMLRLLQEKKAYMAVWSNAYRRNFLFEHEFRFKFGILHEDEQFTPRVILNAQSVVYTGIVFYHYTVRREGAITAQKDKRKNLRDLYSSYLELEGYYAINTDGELRQRLLDYMASSYLGAFQEASAYKYGKAYYHKDFVKRTAMYPKTKLRSAIFCILPALYCWLDGMLRRFREFQNGR